MTFLERKKLFFECDVDSDFDFSSRNIIIGKESLFESKTTSIFRDFNIYSNYVTYRDYKLVEYAPYTYFSQDIVSYNEEVYSDISVKYFKSNIQYYDMVQPELASDLAVIITDYLLDNNDIHRIDCLLNVLEVDKMTEWSMVALISSTYVVKDNLECWGFFYDNVYKKLKHENLPVDEILWGFDK